MNRQNDYYRGYKKRRNMAPLGFLLMLALLAISLVTLIVCLILRSVSVSATASNDVSDLMSPPDYSVVTPITPITPVTPDEPVVPNEPNTPSIPDEPATPEITLYNVPLDRDLQEHIIKTAQSYGIDPAIIFAMIERESSFRPNAVGDGGDSKGLMQIQIRWHADRMERLGCTDLFNPYQNTTVGIDFLAEQVRRYDGDITKALVAYNAGHYRGTVTKYASSVLARAEELNEEISK